MEVVFIKFIKRHLYAKKLEKYLREIAECSYCNAGINVYLLKDIKKIL